MLTALMVWETPAGEHFTAFGVGASRKPVRQRKRILVYVINVFNGILDMLISLIAERVGTTMAAFWCPRWRVGSIVIRERRV